MLPSSGVLSLKTLRGCRTNLFIFLIGCQLSTPLPVGILIKLPLSTLSFLVDEQNINFPLFFLGGDVNNLPKMDGVNQWASISQNLPSERNEILLNIDEMLQTASIRMNSRKYHWKLVVGKHQALLISDVDNY